MVLILCTYHVFLAHSCVHGHLGCRHLLTVVKNAAVSVGVQVFLRSFHLGEYTPFLGHLNIKLLLLILKRLVTHVGFRKYSQGVKLFDSDCTTSW